jgi:hypothetical protein
VKPSACLAIFAGLPAAACGGVQSPLLDVGLGQNFALLADERRGQYQLGCPQATGTVLSSTLLHAIQWGGVEGSEFTVGVAGCGRSTMYVVSCPQNAGNCFAAAPPGVRPGGR